MKTTSLMIVLCAFTLAGCSSPAHLAPTQCKTGDVMTQTTLYFGMSRPHGADISSTEWQSFVDKQVTPRFKAGLTVFAANGQWLGEDGKVAREQSKALLLIHPDTLQNEKDIEALRMGYKQQFQQESVMRVDEPVCVAF